MNNIILHAKRCISGFLTIMMIITTLGQNEFVVNAQAQSAQISSVITGTTDGADEFPIDNSEEWVWTIEPKMIIKESYDTHISLGLSVPEGMVIPDEYCLYYAVTVITHKSKEEVEERTFYFPKEAGDSQDVTIQMDNGLLSKGQKWTYDISVRLVFTKKAQVMTVKDMEKAIVAYGTEICTDGVKVTPYYENNLTLKKGTTTIYTTQKDVAVATVKFSKNTTVKDNLKVEDITYSQEDNKQFALEFEQIGEDLILWANADEDTALGKHTIKVTAAAAEHMYASEAFITVNVLQGIEEGMLSVITPAEQLFKADRKVAKLTFKPEYAKDFVTAKGPDKKKVTWEVLSADGKSLDMSHPLYGMITVKNGTVTVKKNYILSRKREENCFIVKATAADFTGNTVSAYSQMVEIISQVEMFGEVAVVQTDEFGNAVVTARNGDTITSDKLGYVKVFRADAPVKESYTGEELEQWTYPAQYLTYKSGNGAVKITKEGLVTASKPVKNVKISIAANDKSKRKAELNKLTIAYEKPQEIALKIEEYLEDGTKQYVTDIKADNKAIYYSANADATYMVTVMQRNSKSEEWQEVDSYVNFAITVKNGKIIKKSGNSNQYYLINTTKETFDITLKNKENKQSYTYTIFNTVYPSGTAPKIGTKDKLKALSYEGEQTVTYTLKKRGGFAYNHSGKVVLITVNEADKYKSEVNEARYNAFEKAVNGIGYQPVSGEGTLALHFATDSLTPLPAGTYKLWFTFGEIDNEGNFRADTVATAVTLKAQKVKITKGTYTPNISYNMAVKEGGTLTLTGKGKNYLADSVEFSNLRNANVNGIANDFRSYFEMIGNTIRLKENLSDEQLDYITSGSAQNDRMAHVDYKVSLANTDGTYTYKTGTFKIRVTMQDSVRKYTYNSVRVSDAEMLIYVTAYANKKSVNIIHAYATAGSYDAYCSGNDQILLNPKTGSNKPKGGENKVTIYIVPESTYGRYKQRLDELKSAWDNADCSNEAAAKEAYITAMKQYGIKTTATVTLPTSDVTNREYCEEVVEIVNKERRAAGLQPLTINENVMKATFIRAEEISRYFSHDRPDGRSCFTVLEECGVSYWGAGENIAYGYETPEWVMDAWMNSPGHKANIMNGSFTEIGVGCYEKDGILHWVQLFIY